MPAFQSKKKNNAKSKSRKQRGIDSEEIDDKQKGRHPIVGSDFSQGTFERHAAFLGDARMSQPANASERSSFVQQIQRDYGNTYVQRLVDHISHQKADTVQRVAMPGSEPFLRVVQMAGEVVYHFNSLKIHPKTVCNDSLKLIGSLGTMIKDKSELEFSARLSQAMINYLNDTDHDRAMGSLEKLGGIVREALSDVERSGNTKGKDISGWLPKSVNKIPISPPVAASLTWPKPAQEVAPQQQDSSSTDDDPVYSNDYGVAIPVQDQEEDPYNNVSPDEEEVLYSNTTEEEEEVLYSNLEAEEEEDLYQNV